MITGADLGSIYAIPRTKRVWPRNLWWLPLALFLYGGEKNERSTL